MGQRQYACWTPDLDIWNSGSTEIAMPAFGNFNRLEFFKDSKVVTPPNLELKLSKAALLCFRSVAFVGALRIAAASAELPEQCARTAFCRGL